MERNVNRTLIRAWAYLFGPDSKRGSRWSCTAAAPSQLPWPRAAPRAPARQATGLHRQTAALTCFVMRSAEGATCRPPLLYHERIAGRTRFAFTGIPVPGRPRDAQSTRLGIPGAS
eukprot:scaffold2424_cov407-Prasinococcus_capsulatus_cf.AAC.3